MEKRYIKEEKQTPVNYLCDTIVAGGGTAGIVGSNCCREKRSQNDINR